jgi:hypothetical protein
MPDVGYTKSYVSNELLKEMKAERFYKVTPKSGKIITVFDPESKVGVYNVYSIGWTENGICVYTSKGNKDNKIGWTDYIEKILEACNNHRRWNKSFAGKDGNYYTLKKEEGREKLPYTEFSEAAKEFKELPKGKVICNNPPFGPEEFERKVT